MKKQIYSIIVIIAALHTIATAQTNTLAERVLTGKETTKEERQTFWKQIRTSPELDQIIEAQEARVPMSSTDIQGHLNLARLYNIKLQTASSGMTKGRWAGKSNARRRAVLKINPDHWESRRWLALSLSHYPAFLGKTDEAIAEYEKLLATQRKLTPESHHAKPYLELARLYRERVKDETKAQALIDEALKRFPDHPALQELK